MGLDLVELVMEVEKTFDLSIPDEDAATIISVGDLYDVVQKRFLDTQQGCLTNTAFYRLRRALMSVLGKQRKELRPSADLSGLIPTTGRRAIWKRLREVLGLKVPKLRYPLWISKSIGAAATGGAIALIVLSAINMDAPHWLMYVPGIVGGLFVSAFAGVIIALIGYGLAMPFATALGPEFGTVGGLAREVLARNYGTLAKQQNKWNRDELWHAVLAIISDELDVPTDYLTRETQFVRDLGCG